MGDLELIKYGSFHDKMEPCHLRGIQRRSHIMLQRKIWEVDNFKMHNGAPTSL